MVPWGTAKDEVKELGALGEDGQMILHGEGVGGELEVGELGQWDVQKAGGESCGFPGELAEVFHWAEDLRKTIEGLDFLFDGDGQTFQERGGGDATERVQEVIAKADREVLPAVDVLEKEGHELVRGRDEFDGEGEAAGTLEPEVVEIGVAGHLAALVVGSKGGPEGGQGEGDSSPGSADTGQ